MEQELKKCPKCGETKTRNLFGKSRQTKDGLYGWCKVCCAARASAYQKTERGKEVAKKAQQKYLQTEKGREHIRRNNKTDAHKRAVEKHRQSGKLNESRKKRLATPEGRAKYREQCLKSQRKRIAKKDNKFRARQRVRKAINSGKIPRASDLKCSVCGEQAWAYHHENGYEKDHWLDIVPVCFPCHNKLHRPNSYMHFLEAS